LIGGWLGWQYLTPWLGEFLRQQPWSSAFVANSPAMTVAIAATAVGVLAGWVFGAPLNSVLVWFFGAFNAGFHRATGLYARVVGHLLRVSALVLLAYGGLLYLTYYGFSRTPSGFIPTQDKGYLLVNVQLPDSTSLEQTQRVMKQVEEISRSVEGVSHTLAIAGQSILLNANAPNFGALYVMLDEFHQRTGPGLSGDAIAAKLQAEYEEKINEGQINVFGAPPVEGLGTAGGFKVVVEDRGDTGMNSLQAAADKIVADGNEKKSVADGNENRIVADGNENPRLQGLFTSFRANTPWLFLDIDRTKAETSGVSMSEVFNTLQVYLGSLYVNDFNRFGRTWQVNVQGDANYRKQVEDLKQLKIRSLRGGMVPFGAISTIRESSGPILVMRYNMYPAAAINGSPAPGVSSGQAISRMEELTKSRIPQTMRYEWTELAMLQLETGNTAMLVFLLAVVLVFLVLAAQYESWSLPLAVILVVPMCLLCSIAGVQAAKMDINIFTQVGFIVLVGLACKNAILIVEFAKARREAGVPRQKATLEACQLRLRPIMMTSFAFILGVVPLVVSVGAGAEMRRTLGTAVFAGMLGVTLFGIFLTPVFYNVIQWFNDRWRQDEPIADYPELDDLRDPILGDP
jgi:hydrophobe/amphiphile efflux-1 (HAE1) family protein